MRPVDQENKELRRLLHIMSSKEERNQTTLKSFFEMEIRLLGCSQLPELLELILVEFKSHFRLSCVNLILLDPEHAARDLLEDVLEQQTPYGSNLALRFVNDQRLLKELFPDPSLKIGNLSSTLKKLAFPDSPFILSSALLPLIRHNCLIGSLHLGSNDPGLYSGHFNYNFVDHLASVVAVCIENCINQQNLKRLSIIDMLTKVHNRRAFDQEMPRELARASRAHQSLSCLFVDLDHFKLVNDNYGHQAGDKVLRTVGILLKTLLRKTDFVARYGGEEFAILLPNCAAEQALQIANTIREAILKTIIHTENGHPFRISASIGVSDCIPSEHDPATLDNLAWQLIQAADRGVYRAKKAGRNLCVLNPLRLIDPTRTQQHSA